VFVTTHAEETTIWVMVDPDERRLRYARHVHQLRGRGLWSCRLIVARSHRHTPAAHRVGADEGLGSTAGRPSMIVKVKSG
jgi:hypothetical protein